MPRHFFLRGGESPGSEPGGERDPFSPRKGGRKTDSGEDEMQGEGIRPRSVDKLSENLYTPVVGCPGGGRGAAAGEREHRRTDPRTVMVERKGGVLWTNTCEPGKSCRRVGDCVRKEMRRVNVEEGDFVRDFRTSEGG